MITHVRTVGFKGFDIDEDVPLKVIYNGPNKSGKTTRASAIALALYGHIPFSTAGKSSGDILKSFGGDLIGVAVTIDGTEFGRKFSRSDKGKVSQSVQINGKKSSKENFAILLNKAGDPKIADVAEFMKQSDAKKVDTLFDLYPNGDLAKIDIEIEQAKEDVSRLQKKKEGAESTVVRLNNSKNEIMLPPGNIAEVQAEIKSVESQITDLEKQIKDAEIEETRIKAEEKGKRDEQERVKTEAAEKQSGPVEEKPGEIQEDFLPTDKETEDFRKEHFPQSFPTGKEVIPSADSANDDSKQGLFPGLMHYMAGDGNPIDSIQRIIDALNGAGCGTCAALIVAKQELKKYKGVS